jgi:Tol biopolymer transport system component
MGEVYRARDTKLDRQVAIKVLPESVATDADRLSRFEREAKAVAALSHPNILAIHDFGVASGIAYAVTELLEGETLRQRLGSSIPTRKAIDIATQIARGLASAHDKGLVHRDLKPENIFLTRDGHVKILDFGLAKQAVAPNASDAHTALATEPGMVMGTVGYMAPEQVRGEPVDGRADLFAFGAVLYEMLTGARAFQRGTAAETMTAILREDPPELSASRADLPPALDRIVRHALEKDPHDRFQSARDLVFNLQSLGQAPSSGASAAVTAPQARRLPLREIAAWAVAAVAIVVTTFVLLRRESTTAPPGQIASLAMSEEADMSAASPGPGIVVSPDGSRVIFQAARGDRRIVVRALDSAVPSAIPGTELGRIYEVSPDGTWVLFSTLTTLKRMSLVDNTVTPITDVETIAVDATVGPGDQVVFSMGRNLWSVAASGKPTSLTTLNPVEEQAQVANAFLPDGKTLLFTNWRRSQPRIEALSIATGERHVVIEAGTGAHYVAPGTLLFVRDGAVLAVPFDVSRATVSGTPVRVLDHVRTDAFGVAKMAVSRDGGVVVYAAPARTTIMQVTRSGLETPLDFGPRGFQFLRMARDGKRLAFADEVGVWVADLARGSTAHVPTGQFIYGNMDWNPDGSRLVFSSQNTLITTASDGTGDQQEIGKTLPVRKLGPSWSPDGKFIAYAAYFGATNSDIYVEAVDGSSPPKPFIVTPAYDAGAQFSPDGRFIAYTSAETGRLEVYVTPFPGPGPRSTVSVNGGTQVRWSRDGHELYYRNVDDMLAVKVTTTPSFSAGKPELLFRGRYSYGSGLGLPTYDVMSDGRFLMIKNDDETVERPRIVLNWNAVLTRALGGR